MEAYFASLKNNDLLSSFRNTEEANNKPTNIQTCSSCKQATSEENAFFIEPLSQYFHPDCFRCCKCNCSFSTENPFIPYNGKPFCERDFVALGAICNACNVPIKGRALFALDKNWHPEHFTCCECKKQVSKGFFEYEGGVYCENDYKRKILKCQVCKKSIGNYPFVTGLNGPIHKSCLECMFGNGKCTASASSKFYLLDGNPICEYHFHQERNTLCPACDTAINGYCAEVDENTRFHRECWTCAACNCFLEGSYYIHMGGAYCETDIKKLLPNSNSAKKRTTLIYNTADREMTNGFRDSIYSHYQ